MLSALHQCTAIMCAPECSFLLAASSEAKLPCRAHASCNDATKLPDSCISYFKLCNPAIIWLVTQSLHDVTGLPTACMQDEPVESYDAPTEASSCDEEEEQSAEEKSPEPPSTQGWRPRGAQEGAPRRRPALKGGTMRHTPQMDRIAESSGSQPSVREEDLLQVCNPCQSLVSSM